MRDSGSVAFSVGMHEQEGSGMTAGGRVSVG